jgi:hypothetical protein
MTAEPKQKVRYNYEFLQKYCEENNITLLKDYSNEKVNRDTKIEAKCVTESCNEIVNKNFRQMIEKSGCYCNSCSKKNGKIKIKQTCLERYGVEYHSQSNDFKDKLQMIDKYNLDYQLKIERIKEKRKQTNLKKYGVEHPLQNKDIKEKIKQTCLEKYGVEHPHQNIFVQEKFKNTCLEKYGTITPLLTSEIKEKIKQTCLEKYGVENVNKLQEIKDKKIKKSLEKYGVEYPLQNEDIKEKIKQTCIEKYGKEHPLQNEDIKEKIKQTCLEKYGVEYPQQNNKIREKLKINNLIKYGVEHTLQVKEIRNNIKQTCLEKYGVEHVSQVTNIMDKMSKNAYKLKHYILPSGNIIKVQGYEHYAYDELLNIENIKEDDILNGASNVPEIWYYKDDIKKRHYVDIFIPSQNRCIEVKSTWTAEKKQDNIFLKQQAGKELGYNYEIWVYNGKGEKVQCYK